MPVDLMSVFSSTSLRAAESPLGYIMGHPIWFGIIVTCIIVIMLAFWGFSGWKFKFVFYLLGTVIALTSFHDYAIGQQAKIATAATTVGGLVQGATNAIHAVAVRDLDLHPVSF